MNGVSQLLLPSAIFLIIPVAILVGRKAPRGPILVTGFAALVVSVIYWITPGDIGFFGSSRDPDSSPLAILIFYGGLLLVVAGWTLAINAAALGRQTGWILLLVIAGYLTFVALLISVYDPTFCLGNFEPSGFTFAPLCPAVNPTARDIVTAAHFLGPVAILIYGLALTGENWSTLRVPSRMSAGAMVLPVDEGTEVTEPDLNQGGR